MFFNLMIFTNPGVIVIGPSGVRALPLAAGINEGGHFLGFFSFLVILLSFLTTAIQNHRRGRRRVSNF